MQDAGREVRRCMPAILEQPHSAQFFPEQHNASLRANLPAAACAGFRRRTDSRVREVPFPIPAEPVRTEQPVSALVQAFNRSLFRNGLPVRR